MTKKKQPNIIVFAALTTTTLLTWILLEAYLTFTKKTFESIPQAVLTPLVPTLDSKATEELKRRISFSEQELLQLGKTEGSPSAQQLP